MTNTFKCHVTGWSYVVKKESVKSFCDSFIPRSKRSKTNNNRRAVKDRNAATIWQEAGGNLGVLQMFSILYQVVVTWMYTNAEIQQAIILVCVYFILFLNFKKCLQQRSIIINPYFRKLILRSSLAFQDIKAVFQQNMVKASVGLKAARQ
jgi:hypothetical protein